MTNQKLIVFRGRNTENIVNDALEAGVVREDAEIVVVAREGDQLAQPGDVTPSTLSLLDSREDDHDVTIVVIANGGTSVQLVPILIRLAKESQRWDDEADEWLRSSSSESARSMARQWRWHVYDVQRDGIQQIGGDPLR